MRRHIQGLTSFPRKFPITEDVRRPNWSQKDVTLHEVTNPPAPPPPPAPPKPPEPVPSIYHAQLQSIGINDHHSRDHADRHLANGSDPLSGAIAIDTVNLSDNAGSTSFKIKNLSGTVIAKIDSLGNLFLKGRMMKI